MDVDVLGDRVLDVLGLDVGPQLLVDPVDDRIEGVRLAGAEVVHPVEPLVGDPFRAASDIGDVSEIPGLRAVAVQLGRTAVRDVVGELRDDVRVFAFVFLAAAVALVHRKKAEAGDVQPVVVPEVLAVTLAGQLRGLVAGVHRDGHILGRGVGPGAVDGGGGGVNDPLTAVPASLVDRVDKTLDVHPGAPGRVVLVHRVGGERGEVEDHVHVGREVVVEDACLDELDGVVEICRRPQVAVVDGDDLVVGGEAVGERGADEARTPGDEHASTLHGHRNRRTRQERSGPGSG